MPRTYTYNLARDLGGSSDYGSYNPHWVIAVFPFAEPITYDRAKRSAVDKRYGYAVKTKPTILITDDCVSMNVSNGKGSYIKQMQCNLLMANTNYLAACNPGDWVIGWIVGSEEKFNILQKRILAEKPCNAPDLGLKFVGRVMDVHANISVDPATGVKRSSASLSCQAFSELGSMFFYDPNLSAAGDKGLRHLSTLGVLNDLFAAQFTKENNASLFIPELIKIVLGKGVNKAVNPGVDENGQDTGETKLIRATGGGAEASAPAAYILPGPVGRILGANSSVGKEFFSYADLFEVQVGIEHFNTAFDKPVENNNEWTKFFVPTNILEQDGTIFKLDSPILGRFYTAPTFANASVWQQCHQFVNPVVNEMFTSLKIGITGNITLGLTVRQIPFTTDAFVSPAQNLEVTKFLDLPRWKLPSLMVSSVSIGKSDATRVNFVEIYGNAFAMSNAQTAAKQMAVNPPIQDNLDIIRHGLRTRIETVECDISGAIAQEHTSTAWMSLVADWGMNSHLTLSGHIQCRGIQSPVSEGQNIEFEGVVYHIESISHSVNINPDGTKDWTTSLEVSNGVLDNQDTSTRTFPTYAGFKTTTTQSTVHVQGLDDLDERVDSDNIGPTSITISKDELETEDNVLTSRPISTKG
jgi:hypothetical protein